MTSRRLRGDGPVPVVLPRVVVQLDRADTVTITLDGAPVSDELIPGLQLGEALSQIVDQLGTAVRVELVEVDGAVHADILSPPVHQRDEPPRVEHRPHRRELQSSLGKRARVLERVATVQTPVPVATATPGHRGSTDVDRKPAGDRRRLAPPPAGPTSRPNRQVQELA